MDLFPPDFAKVGTYRFNRHIFRSYFTLLILFLAFIAWRNNFSMNYYECSYSGFAPCLTPECQCKNPFYEPPSWKNQEYLQPGKYGNDPRGPLTAAWIAAIGGFAASMALNHFIHNRHEKINISIDEETEL